MLCANTEIIMKSILKQRLCSRKAIHHPFCFEISRDMSGRLRYLQKNGIFVDISSEGARIFTSYALRKGDVRKIYFPVREVEECIPVFTEVMWCRELDEHFIVGLRFLALNIEQL